MAQGFNLTAEINLRGPSNIRTVVADIRRQLGSIDVNINPRLDQNAARNIASLNNSLTRLNSTLSATRTSATDAARAIRDLTQAANGLGNRSIQQNINNAAAACQNLGRSAGGAGGDIGGASTRIEEFGRQSALAVRRFAAFSLVTGTIYALTGAISRGIDAFIDFDKEFVRLQQVTGESAKGLKGLANAITSLSTSLGVNSAELTTVAVTLAQAGLSATDTKRALDALAKSSLAPSFDDINETVEGSIALMRQFGIGANDLEKALGSINAVSAKFAVEASDIITAIQRTGGVFATASRGVSEGTDALNEFIAVFTSVRQTTRESAETIATGLRTVFTRIQRGQTIDALKEFGIELTDLEGKFVGPFEAIRRLSEGLSTLDPRDVRFSQIVEELGGFRQIGKVIPLIQQFAVAQQALKTAQTGQDSLAADAATAQLSLANQIAKVREEFTALIRSIGESESFRSFVSLALQLASALIQVADAAKGVLPALTAIAAIRGAAFLTQFVTGFGGGIGGGRGGRGPRRFATGGLVPGSGNRDTVPAMLTPGEFVIRKKAVEQIGTDNLLNMNKGGSVTSPAATESQMPQLYTRGSLVYSVDDMKMAAKRKGLTFEKLKALLEEKKINPRTGSESFAIEPYELEKMFGLLSYRPPDSALYQKAMAAKITKEDRIETWKQKQGIVSRDYEGRSDREKGFLAARQRRRGFASGGFIPQIFMERGGDVSNEIRQQLDTGRKSQGFSGQTAAKGLGKITSLSEQIALSPDLNDVYGGAFLSPEGSVRDLKGSLDKNIISSIVKGTDAYKILSRANAQTPEGKLVLGELKNIEKAAQAKGDFSLVAESLTKSKSEKIENTILGKVYDAVEDGSKELSSATRISTGGASEATRILKQSNIDNVIGNIYEAIISNAGSPYDEKDRDSSNEAFDFPSGLGSVASNFGSGRLAKIITDAKTRFTSGNISSFLNKVKNFESKKLSKEVEAILDRPDILSGFSTRELADKRASSARSEVKRLVDTRVQRRASGGSISGEDTVPAMLTPGEFVINKKAAKRIGSSSLHSLNRADRIGYNKGGAVGHIQHFASGGGVQKFFAGGAVAGVRMLFTSMPRIIQGFQRLSTSVQTSSKGLTMFGQKVTKLDVGIPRTGSGTARAGGSSAGRRNFDNQGAGVPQNRDIGTGGLLALTAGGAAVEGLSSGIGGATGEVISAVGNDALNYAAIGATIGSMVPVVGTAVGAVAGGLLGLTTGLLKSTKAVNEFNTELATNKKNAAADASDASIAKFAKTGSQLDKGNALLDFSKTMKAEQELATQKGGLRKMTTQENVQVQQRGAEQAIAILSAEMLNTGQTLEQVQKAMDPALFDSLSIEIAEAQYDYIEAQKRINQEFQDAEGNEAKQSDIKKQGLIELQKIRDKNVQLLLATTDAEVKTRENAKKQAEVRKVVESLLDKYRKISASLERFGDEIEAIKESAANSVKGFQGQAEFNNVDRSNEKTLGNLSAYSMAEVAKVANQVGNLAGGQTGQELSNNIQSAKVAQDILPGILRNTMAKDSQGVVDELKAAFAKEKIPFPDFLAKDITSVLGDESVSRQGKSFSELADDPSLLNNLSKAMGASLETATLYLKKYNDALQALTEISNSYAKSMAEAAEWQSKASDIRARSRIELDQALGKNISLERMNEPFDQRIRGLTGDVVFGGSTNPAEIARGMRDSIAAKPGEEKKLQDLLAKDLAIDPNNEAAKKASTAAIVNQTKALANQNNGINNARKALEELANDSSAAANALTKIQEVQRVSQGATNFARKALTSDNEQLAEMNDALTAYTKIVSGQATKDELNSLPFRQQGFEGMDMIKDLVPESMGKRIEAQMTRQMIEAMPNGQELLNKPMALGPDGEKITLGGALDNAASGIDPVQQKYIDAYTEATSRQAEAADELGKSAISVAKIFEGKMVDILNRIGQTMGVKDGIPAIPQAGGAAGAPIPFGALPAAAPNNGGQVANNGNAVANIPGFGPITVDDAAKQFAQSISSGFEAFGTYVQALSGIKLPEKIELSGSHVVDVRITGAAAFDALKKDFTNMISVEVSKAMNQIWNQTGGGIGSAPK
jgi:TP901 family phage tail tape measure protein